jgi:hypothetical protein
MIDNYLEAEYGKLYYSNCIISSFSSCLPQPEIRNESLEQGRALS